MPLGCGQSPLWVWFVGKCPISESIAPHQLCVKPALLRDETNGSSFFPFENSGIFPLENLTTLENEGSEKHIVWNLSAFKFSHESPLLSVLSGAALVEAVRACSSKHTKNPTLWELCQGAGAAKFSSANFGENCTDGDQHLSKENEGSKMSVQAGTRKQMPEICPAAQFGVSLPLRMIPQGSLVSWRTETWSCFHRRQKWLQESNRSQPQWSGAEWAGACVISGWFCTSRLEKVGFTSLDLNRQTWGAPYFLLNSPDKIFYCLNLQSSLGVCFPACRVPAKSLIHPFI